MSFSASTLCTTATVMFYASTPFIPESFFCAQAVGDGNGNTEEINKAAQAWEAAGKQLREFHDEFASVAHSVPDSEWQAADRESYEQQINKYLEQVTTSATAAETASVLLYAVEAALYVYACFAVAEAAVVAANAAAIAVADCTIVGAPEAEAEGLEAGTAAYEALQTASKTLLIALSGIAAAMEAGVIVDTGVQMGQGDSSALGDFGHATLTGVVADAKLLPGEAEDYAKSKLLDKMHESAFPDHSGGSGSDGGSKTSDGDSGQSASTDSGKSDDSGKSSDSGNSSDSGQSGHSGHGQHESGERSHSSGGGRHAAGSHISAAASGRPAVPKE